MNVDGGAVLWLKYRQSEASLHLLCLLYVGALYTLAIYPPGLHRAVVTFAVYWTGVVTGLAVEIAVLEKLGVLLGGKYGLNLGKILAARVLRGLTALLAGLFAGLLISLLAILVAAGCNLLQLGLLLGSEIEAVEGTAGLRGGTLSGGKLAVSLEALLGLLLAGSADGYRVLGYGLTCEEARDEEGNSDNSLFHLYV